MCVPVIGELKEGVGEGAAGNFAMNRLAAVLADGVRELGWSATSALTAGKLGLTSSV